MNLATTTTLRMSPAKMEVQMVVRVTCTGPEDEGAVADTTFKDPKGGIKTTYGVCPKPQRVASGTAIVNILHLGQPFQSHPTAGTETKQRRAVATGLSSVASATGDGITIKIGSVTLSTAPAETGQNVAPPSLFGSPGRCCIACFCRTHGNVRCQP